MTVMKAMVARRAGWRGAVFNAPLGAVLIGAGALLFAAPAFAQSSDAAAAAVASELEAPLLSSADAAVLREANRIVERIRADMAAFEAGSDAAARLPLAERLLQSVRALQPAALDPRLSSVVPAATALAEIEADVRAKGYEEDNLRLAISDIAIALAQANPADAIAVAAMDRSIRVLPRAEDRVSRMLAMGEALLAAGIAGPAFDYAYSAARDAMSVSDPGLRDQTLEQASLLVARSAERPFHVVFGLARQAGASGTRAGILRAASGVQTERGVLGQAHATLAADCVGGDDSRLAQAALAAGASGDHEGALFRALCIRDAVAHDAALAQLTEALLGQSLLFRAGSVAKLVIEPQVRAQSLGDVAQLAARLGYDAFAADAARLALTDLPSGAGEDAVRAVAGALAATNQLALAQPLLAAAGFETSQDLLALGVYEAELRQGQAAGFLAGYGALEAEGSAPDALARIGDMLVLTGDAGRLGALADALAQAGHAEAGDIIRARMFEVMQNPTTADALAAANAIENEPARIQALATILGRTLDPRRLLVFNPLAEADIATLADTIAAFGGDAHQGVRATTLAYAGHAAWRGLADRLEGPARDQVLRAAATHANRKGDGGAANALIGSIDDPEMRAQAQADAAFVLAENGEIEKGAELLKDIADQSVRTEAFRTFSMQRAFALDVDGRLRPDGGLIAKDAGLPGLDWSVGPSRTYRKERDKDIAFDALVGWRAEPNRPVEAEVAVRNTEINRFGGDAMPYAIDALALPYMLRTGADVRRTVPMATGGRARKTLMYHNRFNEKFLQALLIKGGLDRMSELQGTLNPYFIHLDQGTFDLMSVLEQIDGEGLPFDAFSIEANILTIRLPILIGPRATLIISGKEFDSVRLSSTHGSFIVNAGTMYVVDGEVNGWNETTGAIDRATYKSFAEFRPFILSWSGSKTYIASSRLRALGSNQPKAYGLSMSAGPNDDVNSRALTDAPTGTIVDNYFENFFYGYYSYEANGVEIIGNEYRDHVIYGPDPHDRSYGLRIAFNTTYDIEKKHGIIISREVDDSYIVGNLTFANEGSGLMIDRESIGTVVYANTAFGNGQDGLSIFESACTLVLNNDFSGNDRSGVKSRNSVDTFVLRNAVERNRLDGIELYIADLRAGASATTRDFAYDPYIPTTTALLGENRISQNGTGIISRGVSGMTMFRNAFIRQSPSPIGGDLAPLASRLLTQSAKAPTAIATTCKPKLPRFACRFRTKGIITLDDRPLKFAGQEGEACETVEGTVQNAAFESIIGETGDGTN
ncbi:MAG: right-handed parallel beta-helix repeat-containing protein [Rhizobiaceae bacterium]|nr:right-handed parallel beta-helix repeat-containing protein [Rhizobiaceae bacterium]